MKYLLVLFDLDGVLIDSRTNMEAAWSHVCTTHGLDIPFERYFAEIGLPFAEIVRRIGALDSGLDAADLAATYSAGSVARFDLIRPYDGIGMLLKSLRDDATCIGVVTSKDADRTSRAIDIIGTPFDTVCAPAPGLAGKPAPDQLLAAAASIGVAPVDAVYIGDMAVDLAAARNAGMGYVHAEWGYGATPDGTDFAATDPSALLDWLRTR